MGETNNSGAGKAHHPNPIFDVRVVGLPTTKLTTQAADGASPRTEDGGGARASAGANLRG